ncbi:proline-rich receptor-like protein kinase PERK13 [Cucumis sativus]|uniref:non-specific serine/threonine protein kinase n=1 Tax=Cucumis sativus TaxID=3659 RepID=A0A0A0KSC3_CUCSA|nr:proline-rich receptor-like protein kinase PERK13 [Cucumis sativus]KGN51804.1 hypothetical protein Csa_008034 [Cucumis sativus]
MSSSNDTSSPSSDSVSDSSLPPEASDSSPPPPPSPSSDSSSPPPSPSTPPSPVPDDISSLTLNQSNGPSPSTFPSAIKAPPIDGESSPSSSPPAPPNPGTTPPAPTGGSDSNDSDETPSPPPEDSASPPLSPPPSPRPPPPSPPPPQDPSVVGVVDPPPSPVPTAKASQAPPRSPPSPISEKDPSTPVDQSAIQAPNTPEETQPSTPTNPLPPSENPVVIPSPGANPATGKQTPSSPDQGTITTPTSESNILSPPTATSTSTPNNSPHSSDSTPVKSPLGQSNAPSTGLRSHTDVAVGAAVAGVFVIALFAVIFVFSRKKKRRGKMYTGPYMPPKNFCVKADGNYYPQEHGGNSGSSEGFYTQVPHTPLGNSFGSQKGTGYSGSGMESSVINSAKFYFSYEELMEVTSGFSRQNILGEGGFGCVYQGWLPEGKTVAVKQLKAGSGQGEREFKAEVEIISRVHHRHLVSLVGYCVAERHRLLIYEFVPNKTLEHHLHGKGVPVLDWSKRLKIALGSAKGLAYLHEDCHPRIIHRDIKSANILLDDAFEAQVADFGLAKLTNDTNTHVSTRVMGTFGYMAPEYASSGKLTDRSDVFSFGVVLLELITGRKPVDSTQPLGDESLVEWARPHLLHALETGEFDGLVDPRLGKQYVESEMFRMIEAAAACVRHSAPKRPRMVQVVRAIDIESDMSDLSNGVKYGQSTIYDSGQYNQDISRFRRMALGTDSFDYDSYSSEYNSGEMNASRASWRFQNNSSGESETQAFKGGSVTPQNHPGGRQF